ncbi:MAG TPA: DUF4382 domain-containing protein [Planctomycetota bacterium]|nr:DUF4382 domain-containing protein [Planctomycetota bacterium]
MPRSTPTASLSLSILALLGLAACGGSGATDAPALAQGDLLLTDAPADELLYLRAELRSLALERADGTLTGELLDGPVPVDVVHLDGLSRWLSTGNLAPGTYTAAHLGFDPLEFEAAAQDGTPVTVVAIEDTLRAEFAEPVTLGPGAYRRFVADFDLLNSLEGDVASGTLYLAPTGPGEAEAGEEPRPVDPFLGIVLEVHPAESTLVVRAFAHGDLEAPVGPVRVTVTPDTVLLDVDGDPFPSVGAFFAALVPSVTLVEVEGALVGGELQASLISIEEGHGPGGVVAELRGRIVELDPGLGFELLIQDVLQGTALVESVLGALGDPASIAVSIGPDTHFAFEDGEPTTADSLAVGQEVRVEFLEFVDEPFPAHSVEIAQSAFKGEIVSVDGLPDSIVIHVEPWHPAILCGQIGSGGTDVTVLLGDAEILLQVIGKPELVPGDLVVGLVVVVQGDLSGPPEAPTIDATKLLVKAGRVDKADVAGFDEAASTFATEGGVFLVPFGGGVEPGPLRVTIEPGCYFQANTKSEAAFYDLLAKQPVEVRVQGLGTGTPGEVRAFLIKAKPDHD